MTHLLGHKNVTNINLVDLSKDAFKPAELSHKLANISDEIGNEVIDHSGRLKEASSGSPMTVSNKFGQPFDMKSYAKITYSCNEPPEIKDTSDALKIRLKFVEFPYTFTDAPDSSCNQKKKKSHDKLMAELLSETPGIINWAIEGLVRLHRNEFKFSYGMSNEETWTRYQRLSNPIAAFVHEWLELTGDDGLLGKPQAYITFTQWAKIFFIKLNSID